MFLLPSRVGHFDMEATMICGVDPGIAGAIAFLDPASPQSLDVVDMPTLVVIKNKRAVDAHALAALLSRPLDHVYLERAQAMPGQGTVSMFNYGEGFGIIRGILAARGVAYTLVPPATWKRALQVPAAKDGAKARASQLLPASAHLWTRRVKDHGKAEAALLALYGARQLQSRPAHDDLPAPATGT
jgi:crossover junction endodeoxyribonuclease RuvC